MSSFVLCELVLAIAALAALGLVRRSHLPASLFWAIGFGLIMASAVLGILAFAGVTAVREAHLYMTRLAAGVGSVALLLAALFAFLVRVGGSLALFVTALAVALLIATGIGAVPSFGLGLPAIAMIGLLIIALVSLGRHPRAASWLLAGVAFAVLAEIARQGLLHAFPVHPTNLYHLMLAISVCCLGLAARDA